MRSLISPFVYLFRASLCIGPHFSNSLISAIAVLTLLPMPLRVLADCPPGFGAPSFFTVDGSPYHVVAGDFNNDGKLDLAAACYSVPGNISVLIGNGDGSFSTSIAYPVSGRCFRVVVGDCNNDNNLDLAVLHEYGWGILLGNGTGAFQTVTGIQRLSVHTPLPSLISTKTII